jgi:hypothetical protein
MIEIFLLTFFTRRRLGGYENIFHHPGSAGHRCHPAVECLPNGTSSHNLAD